MTSRHLVDPELLPVLDFMPAFDFTSADMPAIRAAIDEQFAALAPPLPEIPGVTVESITVPGPHAAPPVRILVHRPTEITQPVPAILHIHGGGYVIGSPDTATAAHPDMVKDLGCAIFSVDYRLAPETVFPGAVEDCYAALRWITEHAAELRIDPRRIGVMGESAGGGLAAGLALLARDRNEFPLAFQHLIYPMLDDRTCVADPNPFTGEFIWTPAQNMFGWTSLLGAAPGSPGISPYAAAARASDLAGLPPTFIAVGALDLFLAEDVEYARRLACAGVPVELHVYPGAFHAFQMMPTARVTIDAERDSRAALRRALYG
jgi:triacylglycerol lipase